ncbi:MAG: class I SAM-dependent rRNA methyltransferase [bacterium]|nr:class I SAM-dependent rRNA methyltransferase [bacterium]
MPRNQRLHRSRTASKKRKRGAASGLWLPEELPLCPSTDPLPTVKLAKPSTHPNIFRKRIVEVTGQPTVGDWVRVICPVDEQPGEQMPKETSQANGNVDYRTMGYGWFNPKSEIAVRMVRWSAQLPDVEYWNQLLDRAVSLRSSLLNLDSVTDCYRVLHAEADGIPGFVVDRYADCLSAEIFCAAAGPRARQILPILSQKLGTRHWLIQPGPHLQSQDGYEFPPQSSPDLPARATVHEHGIQFTVEFAGSHKTGFFCDQRDNRRQLTEYCAGRSVLDLCCYTGGFAVSAASVGKASSVIGVDLDASPLEMAKRNAAQNQCRVKFTQADAFAYMRDMLRLGRTFDVVVLDPPKLIRNRGELEEGTRKHFDLNRLAMQLVSPGGILLTCSCAGLLAPQEFSRLVRSAARSAFRPTEWNPNPIPRSPQILASTGAASCHPISTNCPETEYLKAIWMRL